MITLYIKRFIVNVLTNSAVGFVLRLFYPKKISFQGAILDSTTLTNKNLASVRMNLYETKEVLMVNQFLDPKQTVIEVGSSLGIVSSQICKVNSGFKIFVEANPTLMDKLKKNVALNCKDGNYEIKNLAINHLNEPLYFSQASDNLIGHITDKPSNNSVQIEGSSLTSIIEKHKIEKYSLVMDIEGAEYDLVRFDKDAFKNCTQILAEFHDLTEVTYQQIVDLYVELGYEIKYQYHNRVFFEKVFA